MPTAAELEAENVTVLPAEPVTVTGLNVAVTPDGRPLALRVMGLLKPLTEVTVTVPWAVVPCMTVAPEAATAKPGPEIAGTGGNAFCTSMVNSVFQKVPAGGELGRACVGWLLANALL